MSTQKKCDQCGKLHIRRRFCCNKCKDLFHNLHNPRGKFAFMKNYKGNREEMEDIDYEGAGWDAHKD